MGGRKTFERDMKRVKILISMPCIQIKSDKLCHCIESNESVLMTVPQMKMHAPITVLYLNVCGKRNTRRNKIERKREAAWRQTNTINIRWKTVLLNFIDIYLHVFTSTNSKYLPIHFKVNANRVCVHWIMLGIGHRFIDSTSQFAHTYTIHTLANLYKVYIKNYKATKVAASHSRLDSMAFYNTLFLLVSLRQHRIYY